MWIMLQVVDERTRSEPDVEAGDADSLSSDSLPNCLRRETMPTICESPEVNSPFMTTRIQFKASRTQSWG